MPPTVTMGSVSPVTPALAIPLGIIAGLLDFVPVVGPMIAAIPARYAFGYLPDLDVPPGRLADEHGADGDAAAEPLSASGGDDECGDAHVRVL